MSSSISTFHFFHSSLPLCPLNLRPPSISSVPPPLSVIPPPLFTISLPLVPPLQFCDSKWSTVTILNQQSVLCSYLFGGFYQISCVVSVCHITLDIKFILKGRHFRRVPSGVQADEPWGPDHTRPTTVQSNHAGTSGSRVGGYRISQDFLSAALPSLI